MPGTVEAAARENELAAYAMAALHRFGRHLTTAQHHLLSGLRDAHRAHAAVLGQLDPTVIEPSTSPTASTTGAPSQALGPTPKATLAKLRKLETAASKSYAELVATPAGDQDQQAGLVLLWGSIATAAASYATLCTTGTDPGPNVTGMRRADVALPDQNTAASNLLSQCYAIIFGYQSAIAYLSGSHADAARKRLVDLRNLRDRLAGTLSADQLSVPAPDAAYRLPLQPKSDASAVRLIGAMETRMLPYLGQWLATADAQHRSNNLGTMITSARSDLTWSSKITVWPGYPTA